MNLNEDLSPADLKFLEKFGLLGDKNVEEATPPEPPKPDDPQDEATPDAPAEGENEEDSPTKIPADVEPGEQPDEGQPDDEGEHKHDQEAEDEGFDMDTEEQDTAETAPPEDEDAPPEASESDDEAEQEAESEAQPGGEPEPEVQGEAEEGEADDDAEPEAENSDEPSEPEGEDEQEGEQEMQEQQEDEQQQEPDVPENPEPIALDMHGNPIFVGSKIVSKADGNFVDEESDPYVADVLGRWVGSEDFANDNPAKMILIVERHDDEDDSDSEMKTAEGRGGWATQSDLSAVMNEDEPEPEDADNEQEPEAEQPPQQPEPPKQPYFLDAEGAQLFDGDQVIVVTQPNWCDWPLEAIALCVMGERNGTHNPALMPQNFEDDTLGPWISPDGEKCFAVAWGNTLEGIRKLTHNDERPERPRPPVPEPQPEQPQDDEPEQPQDEPQPDEPEAEGEPEDEPEIPESPEEDDSRKPMTKQQRKRFENLAGRIFKKAEDTFGGTKQSAEIGPLLPGGVFDGEEVAQVLEVVSNGITYRISLSAERVE